MAGLGVRVVSDMDRSLQQGVLKKRNRPNARQRPHRLALLSRTWLLAHLIEFLQERLGLTKDADFSAVLLTRDQFGMTFLDQLGVMDICDLLELSKGLSKIGAKDF